MADQRTEVGVKGQKLTMIQRELKTNTRDLGPTNESSPLKQSMDRAPIITTEQRKTGRVG